MGLIIPAVVLLLCAFVLVGLYYRRESIVEWVAHQKKGHEHTLRTGVVVLLIVFNIGTAILLQCSRINRIGRDKYRYTEAEIQTIIAELPRYGVKKESHLADRIQTAFARIVSQPTGVILGIWRGLFVVCFTAFIGISAIDQFSDNQLDEWRRDMEYAQKMHEAAYNVIREIRHVVLAKYIRLAEALKEGANIPQHPECEYCEAVLDPEGQIQTITESAHGWFKSIGTEAAALRVALFIQDEGYLHVLASTDGSQPEAVSTPNRDELKEHYRVGAGRREITKAIVVKAFEKNSPQIIPDTQDDSDFNFFTDPQHNYLKSIVACPLRLRDEDHPFGVLAVDANVTGYFQPQAEEIEQIVLLADEVALRLSFELNMLQYLGANSGFQSLEDAKDGPEDTCE